MVLDFIWNHWNDVITVATALIVGYYTVRHYRSQPASFDIETVTDAEYHDFDNYTRYEFTANLRNDGRDPVSIPDAGLEINGESIDVSTHEVDGRANLKEHEFRTIRLDSNEYDTIDLHAIGDAVSTRDPLTGWFWMKSSDGRVKTGVTFDRAP
jgi:hypothetical protein